MRQLKLKNIMYRLTLSDFPVDVGNPTQSASVMVPKIFKILVTYIPTSVKSKEFGGFLSLR